MMIKEWKCAKHGAFEGSHAICPAFGCDSANVEREIRTAPAIRSETTTRTDAGLKETAKSYGVGNLKSAKEGEVTKPTTSGGVIWGLDNAQKMLGFRSPDAMLHKPQTYEVKDKEGKVHKFVDKYGGMQHAGGLVGNMDLFKSKVETIVSKDDAQARKKLGA